MYVNIKYCVFAVHACAVSRLLTKYLHTYWVRHNKRAANEICSNFGKNRPISKNSKTTVATGHVYFFIFNKNINKVIINCRKFSFFKNISNTQPTFLKTVPLFPLQKTACGKWSKLRNWENVKTLRLLNQVSYGRSKDIFEKATV